MKNETTLGRGLEPQDLKVTCFYVIKIFPSFYMQRVLVALQQTETTFILRCVVIICEGSSSLNIFSSVPPLSLFNMFFTIEGGGGRVQVLDFFLFPLQFALFGVILACHDLCVLPSCTFSSPFVGLFVLLIIGKFSSFFNSFT